MFSVSSKADYGLIVMVELAKSYGNGLLSVADIANRKLLSAQYLLQIMQLLREAGLVVSKEGKGGGYQLSRVPQDISLLHIIEAIEGPIHLVRCIKEGDAACACSHQCDTKRLWPAVIEDIRQQLAKRNLSDIAMTLDKPKKIYATAA